MTFSATQPPEIRAQGISSGAVGAASPGGSKIASLKICELHRADLKWP